MNQIEIGGNYPILDELGLEFEQENLSIFWVRV